MIGTVQAFALACGFLFVSLYDGNLNGINAPAVRQLPRHHRARRSSSLLAAGGRWRSPCWRSSAGRCCSRRSTPTWPRPAGVPVRPLSVGFLVLLGRGRGRDQPDHRLAARVRAAGAARPPPPRPSPPGPAARPRSRRSAIGAGGHVGRAGARLLLAVPDRVLGHDARVRGCTSSPALGLVARSRTGVPAAPRRSRDHGASIAARWPTCSATPSSATRSSPAPPSRSWPGSSATSSCCASQVFTGDALSHVAFTGALGRARLRGRRAARAVRRRPWRSPCCSALLGPRGRADDVVIGSVFAWVLGLGVLFLSIFTTSRAHRQRHAPASNVLFGSIFGLDGARPMVVRGGGRGGRGRVWWPSPGRCCSRRSTQRSRRPGACRCARSASSSSPWSGATAAEATQAVGALLLLGLLAAPAGIAQRLTIRPFRAMWSVGRHRRRCDVDRSDRQLRGRGDPAELRHRLRVCGGLRGVGRRHRCQRVTYSVPNKRRVGVKPSACRIFAIPVAAPAPKITSLGTKTRFASPTSLRTFFGVWGNSPQ